MGRNANLIRTVGIPKEIKRRECRVAGLPEHARRLRDLGVQVLVQRGAGAAAGWPDAQYEESGAILVDALADVYREADLLWKVKEILPPEFDLLRRGQIILTYLHAAPRPAMTRQLCAADCVAIAYEEIRDPDGSRPLLQPMSRLAGAGAIAVAIQYSQAGHGGSGMLLFATDGVPPARVVILGAGVAGQAAARAALGIGADVTLLEVRPGLLPHLRQMFPGARVVLSGEAAVRAMLPATDVLINCTMWMPGDPHIITRDMLRLMPANSLIIDVSADPHGAIETSEETTHDDPIRVVDGIRHYCVQNLPSLFARTACTLLADAAWPYLERVVRHGLVSALAACAPLRQAVVVWHGRVVGDHAGRAHGAERMSDEDLLRTVSG